LFVFANSGEGFLRGSDCIRAFVKKADLDHPELMTATNNRKVFGTVMQVNNHLLKASNNFEPVFI
jgi:hypothetical protein